MSFGKKVSLLKTVSLLAISLFIFLFVRKRFIHYKNQIFISENRFKTLVETTPDWIWEIDTEANFLYSGPGITETLGYLPEEIVGKKTAIDLLAARDKEKIWNEFQSTIKNKVPMKGMININQHKDGHEVVMESHGTPYFDEDGKLLGYRGIDRDITIRHKIMKELEEAKKKSEKANLAKSIFLAHMSHEIRTPLHSILGMVELLEETGLTEEQRNYIELSKRSGEALLGLINDILDMSKIEAGQLEISNRPFDFDKLLLKSMSIFNVKVKDKGLELKKEYVDCESVGFINGDENRLAQILLNLLGNSIKFTNSGYVKVVIEKIDNKNICITIEDTGIGIPLSNQKTIFEPFNQVDTSITRQYGGTGLGLSISRKLIEAMNGSITVFSEEGAGTSMIIKLPIQPVANSNEMLSPHEKITSHDSPNKMTILLADDSDENQILMKAFLKKTSLHLECVDNGLEAFHKVKDNHYDLILMDLEMPVMDGRTATIKIREWEKANNHRPNSIVALTAHVIKEIITDTLESGFDHYLPKPISKKNLLEFLDNFQNNKSSNN
jgi:PAS domain S-box-containing protein